MAAAESLTLLWSDEFETGSQPNSDIWSYDLGGGGWGNGELQVYTDTSSNILVKDGSLKIVAQKDDATTPPSFTSARIKTEDKLSFKYGTLEARIQSPDVDAGLWPAFWTLGSDFQELGWPKAGEIDIMELGQGLARLDGLANNRVVSAAHWDYQGTYATYASSYDSPFDLSQSYHIYRLEWTPDRIATFVDDSKVWEMAIDESSCIDCEELHKPHFIVLSMAVGGGFTSGSSSSSSGSSCIGSSSGGSSSSGGCGGLGPEDITAPFPGEMYVDWIRLYDNGFSEVSIPSTPSPNIAQAQTSPPTKAPVTVPRPTNEPTATPSTRMPSFPPTMDNRQVYTEPPNRPPSSPPTRGNRQIYSPPPTPITTVPRDPSTSPPHATSLDDGDDNYYNDSVDCVSSGSSGSRSGKSGKSGKSASGSSRSTSGGKSGKGGKGSRKRRGRRLSGSEQGKGGGKGESSSGIVRSGCPGQARSSHETSYLTSYASAPASVGTAMSVLLLSVVGILSS